jgi:hypothetical protein
MNTMGRAAVAKSADIGLRPGSSHRMIKDQLMMRQMRIAVTAEIESLKRQQVALMDWLARNKAR